MLNAAASTIRYPCSGATLCRNRLPPNTSATIASIRMLSIFDPSTSPRASSGLSIRTAVMLLDSSGSDVASATNMLPTNSRPHPVNAASASPYLASSIPRKITPAALPRNTRTTTVIPAPSSRLNISVLPRSADRPDD